ncbi:MAG TPA: zinc ribbon domain-containing protein [Gemmatimonadaceae bacterium]|nr:zinc ribbon domain-containing protein [Gemmatimonadaceae bacterium]
MDDLDRLFRRVVHNVRAAYPELLTQQFEVSQLYQQVVPYRLNRRELAVETVEDYELALMQLLSGARGYLTGDADMQRALQDELESLNPDLSSYRGYATSRIAIAADAVRAIDQQPMHAGAAMAASTASTVASRATEPMATSDAASPGARSPAPKTAPSAAPRTASSAAPKSAPAAPKTAPAAAPRSPTFAPAHKSPTFISAPKSAPSSSAPMSSSPKSAPAPATTTGPAKETGAGSAHDATCRYCSGMLPVGKNIVFCPHCGHDLTVQHCPACNTELEIGWRFCITCGRQVS